MNELLRKIDKEAVLWVVAFTGSVILVGLGKLKPETIEMFLFAIVGRAATKGKPNGSN